MNKSILKICVAVFLLMVFCVACDSQITETGNPTTIITVPGTTDDNDPVEISIEGTGANDPTGGSTEGADGGGYVAADQIGFGNCETEETQAICVAGGGAWASFPNGCRDSCYAQTHAETTMCTQSFTWGCECGGGRCWDSCTQTCVGL